MANNPEFIQYLCEQASGAGDITARLMFGGCAIYCDGKIVGLVGDNEFYLKPNEAAKKILGNDIIEKAPYEGSKNYYLIESIDDAQAFSNLIKRSYEVLPMQAKRKKPRMLFN